MTSTGPKALSAWRRERQFQSGLPDQRGDFQRDRDRVLYSSAFRRLGGVTQVVGAVEGHAFHNRLTHTLEAAQIARRLAEKFLDAGPLASELEINPDVAEAAALIHDLGHPPFGHAGEQELDRVARNLGNKDGFQGNAQSFRLVTRLIAHRPLVRGLNLTRATLYASLKYPWFRDATDPKRREKYGVYEVDAESFDWVRSALPDPNRKSIEAQIMDLADDIAYSVHDLEDFVRAGLIPLSQLRSPGDRNKFIDEWVADPKTRANPSFVERIEGNRETLAEWLEYWFDIRGDATYWDRVALKTQCSGLIGALIGDARLVEPDAEGQAVYLSDSSRVIMRFCQRLVWHFVINNPRLATIQHGQRAAVKNLLHTYRRAVVDACGKNKKGGKDLIPPRFRVDLEGLQPSDRAGTTRVAVDIVSSMTDQQAVMLHRRFMGIEQRGSVTDIIH